MPNTQRSILFGLFILVVGCDQVTIREMRLEKPQTLAPQPEVELPVEAEEASIVCPEGFVVIPGDSTEGLGVVDPNIDPDPANHSGSSPFCLMKYEAKNATGDAFFAKEGVPWTNITRIDAQAACEARGLNLPSNPQWMATARNIEGVSENWNEGDPEDPSDDVINAGHADESTNSLKLYAASTDDDPCYQTENPGCDDPDHEDYYVDFVQKRTHVLSNGEVIWDFGGNAWEWVRDDFHKQPANNFMSMIYTMSLPAPDESVNLALLWGPAEDHSEKTNAEKGALGYAWLDPGYGSGAIIRGGGYNSRAWGQGIAGIYTVWLGDTPNGRYSSTGFRCSLVPSATAE